jgi:predicted O-linked N-acetylglucosamine transferase (SPINDLY family)
LSFLKVLELKVGKENLTEHMEQWFSDFISIDFQPANFASQQDLKTFLTNLEDKIDRCLQHLELIQGATEMLQPVIDQFLFNLTGFYIAYLQENVVELMTKYSSLMSQALGLDRAKVRKRSGHTGKIRLGLASGLLKSHNGANWSYNWLANLPDDYEIFTYALNSDSDWLTQKFSSLGTHRLLRFDKNNFRRSIELMLDDELDLLMLPDVGMTSASRVLSLHRVAPVQFTAWGHPITTGSKNIDFFLSSDLMEPENAQSHYSERLIRIPNLGLYIDAPPPPTNRTTILSSSGRGDPIRLLAIPL